MESTKTIKSYKNRVNEIESVLQRNHEKFENMGSSTGLLGMSVFHYYKYLFTNNDSSLELLSQYIIKSFEGFDENYKGYSVIRDTIEIGKYLHFLNTNSILEENPDSYLQEADTLILDHLKIQLTKQNIDPILGTISCGYYLISRLKTTDFSKEIDQILNQLEILAIRDFNGNIHWENNFKDDHENLEIELGFTHGIAGIVNFLLSVTETKLFTERCRILIDGALAFILKHKTETGINLFPFEVTNNTTIDYQNLCYGDLGIGYVFLRSGKITSNEHHHKIGTIILKNSAIFKDDNCDYIKDATLLYGSAGLHSFFDKLTEFVNDTEIKEAKEYWLQKTLNFNHHEESPWAGYLSYNNQYTEATQLSFSEGICGIGISIIADQINPIANHLTFLNYTF